MSNTHTGNMQPEMDREEHARISNTDGKKVFNIDSADNVINFYDGVESAEGVNTETGITGDNWSTDTYTGAGEQNRFNQVGVALQTDEAGTLHFDFSVDGINWSNYPVSGFKVLSGIYEFHTAVKLGRYFRPRFMGTSGRSYFRLYSYYGNDFVPSVAPLNQAVNLDHDGTVVRPTFPWLDTVRGLQGGVTFINKFGKNADCTAGDTIDISETPIDPPVTAEKCLVASSNDEDNGAGSDTGAITMKIFGLDENYDLAEETLTLNGTTNVETANKYWFVYRMYILTGASFAGALGTITCTSQDSGTAILGTIEIGSNQTQMSNYQIPAGHTGYFNLPQITLQNTNANSLVELALFKREFGGVDRLQVDFLLQAGAVADFQQKEFGAPLTFNEKDIIYWKVISSSDQGTNAVTVDYDIWLVNEV